MAWTVILGGNEITNCEATLEVQGLEVFRLRERSGDDQLVADFEIRDDQDNLVAKVAKNNAVFTQPGLQVRHGANFSEVVNPSTEEVIARAEEVSQGVISIIGTFRVGGFRVEATKDFLKLNGTTLIGNEIVGFGKAIVLKAGQISIGVRQ